MPDIHTALKEAEELVAALKAFEAQGAGTAGPGAHLALLERVDRVRVALEDPYDLITRQLTSTTVYAAAWTMYKIGAFTRLPLDGGSVTAAELAEHCNAEVSIITRCMRCLIVTGVISEPEPDTYAHTPKSMAYLPDALGGFLAMCVDISRVEFGLPDYIKLHKPEDLFDLRKSPTAFNRGKEGMTYYEVISEDPAERAYWNATLQAMDKNMPILNMFPFASLKEQVEKEPERPFIVDIGGGRGQALLAIYGDIGTSYGAKLILQDLPDVIDSLKEEDIPGIEKMAYDIFSGPQPVKNAHVYFMRRLLHDFYDPVCVTILKNTVASMAPDSRVIICDMLVPEKVEVGGSQDLYWLDMALLCISGKEKTEKEFKQIFDEVGLELVKIYPSGIGATVMLETRLKKQG